MECVTLLIKNVPSDKIDHVKTFIKTLKDVTDMNLTVELAPIELAGLIKCYDMIYNEITSTKKLLLTIKAEGFDVGTEKVEKIVKLNIQHLSEAILKLTKELNEKIDALKIPKEKPISLILKKPSNIIDILKRNIPELKRTYKAIEIIALLASNPEKQFTSEEIATTVYGKKNIYGRGHVTKYLKKFSKYVSRRKVNKTLYFKWKGFKLLK